MSNKVKPGLYFGIGITFIFLLKDSIAWLTGKASSSEIIKSIVASIIAGLFSGFVVGWLTDKLLTNRIFTTSPAFDLNSGEAIHFQTTANHFKGIEAVGGFLCLTDKRLLFKSHNLNIQKHELSISLSDIVSVDKYKTFGLMNNGFTVNLGDHKTEKFVVKKAKQWIENIDGRKNGLQYGPANIPAE